MKLKILNALAAIGILMIFSSCDKDNPKIIPGSSLTQRTYTMTDGALIMNYNGTPLIGKTATFIPNANGTATITLSGESIHISELMEVDKNIQPSFSIPSVGVLPGSPDTEINVTLKGEVNNCTFEGNGETDYCSYDYSGIVSEDKLEFNLTNVRLKNRSLVGKWILPELYQSDPEYPEFGATANIYNVARVVWQSEKQIEITPDFKMPVESVLGMTLLMPLIGDGNEKVSAIDMLTMVLKSVTFMDDGNVTSDYINAADMSQAPVTSPMGIAQYVITSEGNLRIFLNPYAIIENVAKAAGNGRSRAADISLVAEEMMRLLIPMLSQGIPVNYGKAITDANNNLNEDSNILSFYLGTETLLPILKAFVPLLSDEEFVNGIVEEAMKDPSMEAMAPMLSGILSSLPGIIDTTTKIEIGINLKK